MKKILFLLFSLCCLAQVAFAEENVFSLSSYKFKLEETATVYVNMNTPDDYGGFQFDLYLPDGVSIVTTGMKSDKPHIFEDGPWGEDDVSLSCTPQKDGAYRFIQYANVGADKPKAGSGIIIEMKITVSENATLGSSKVRFANTKLSTVDGKSVPLDDTEFDAKVIEEYSISAVSSDEVKGSVEIAGGGDVVEIGTSVTVSATPVSGYEFVNWTAADTEVSTENPYSFTASADLALVGNFKAKKYEVRFVFGNDTEDMVQTLDFGSAITAPADPSKIGYTFTGWDPAVDVTVPDHDVTYVAQFSISPEVNFVAIDNSGSETVCILKPGDSIELTDGDYKSVSVTEDVDDVDISYTRSFSSTDWQALYVPFALDVSTDLAGFDVYEFSSASEDVVYVSKVESTTTEPNTPYFIRAKESTGSKTFTLTGTTLVATQECKVGTSYFDVMGTYAKLEYSDVDATWYALKDGKFLIAGEGAVLNPFRFYLKKKGTASVKDCINIVFEGSTDISTFGNGKEMEGSSFNIAGQAVDVDYKGIVIINGKKIFKE